MLCAPEAGVSATIRFVRPARTSPLVPDLHPELHTGHIVLDMTQPEQMPQVLPVTRTPPRPNFSRVLLSLLLGLLTLAGRAQAVRMLAKPLQQESPNP